MTILKSLEYQGYPLRTPLHVQLRQGHDFIIKLTHIRYLSVLYTNER